MPYTLTVEQRHVPCPEQVKKAIAAKVKHKYELPVEQRHVPCPEQVARKGYCWICGKSVFKTDERYKKQESPGKYIYCHQICKDAKDAKDAKNRPTPAAVRPAAPAAFPVYNTPQEKFTQAEITNEINKVFAAAFAAPKPKVKGICVKCNCTVTEVMERRNENRTDSHGRQLYTCFDCITKERNK